MPLRLFSEQHTKDLREPLQRSDDLVVNVPMLRGWFENGPHLPTSRDGVAVFVIRQHLSPFPVHQDRLHEIPD
jgi:hypothetical protein